MAHPPHASRFSAALRVQRRSCRQMRPQQLRDVAPAEAQRDVPGLGKMPSVSLGTIIIFIRITYIYIYNINIYIYIHGIWCGYHQICTVYGISCQKQFQWTKWMFQYKYSYKGCTPTHGVDKHGDTHDSKLNCAPQVEPSRPFSDFGCACIRNMQISSNNYCT